MRPLRKLSVAVLFAAMMGCAAGEELPRTYYVTGTAYDADGKPLTEGLVHFQHASDSTFTVSGSIGPNGSFTLKTLKGKSMLEGAPEGEYQVTIIPGVPKGQHGAAPAIVFPQTFRVEAKENTFELRPGKPE